MKKLFFGLCLFQTLIFYAQPFSRASESVSIKLVTRYSETGIKGDIPNQPIYRSCLFGMHLHHRD